MLQEFICTETCIHDRRYLRGEKYVREESALPHDVKTGALIHFKPVDKAIIEMNAEAEITALRDRIAKLESMIDRKTESVEPAQVLDVESKPELPTNQQLKDRLTELEISWKDPTNKETLLNLMPVGEVLNLKDGGIWIKE